MSTPLPDERPTLYADRVGRAYSASVSGAHKKSRGQYLTSPAIADFMAQRVEARGATLRVLDPGAGAGILSCALAEALITRNENEATRPQTVEIVAYETDANLAQETTQVFTYLQAWAQARAVTITYELCQTDFVLAHAELTELRPRLFSEVALQAASQFDIAIGNPPYLKIAKQDPRAQAVQTVVHGQPNLYALFMAVTAKLLKGNGELIFITPRSYTSGPYFRRFREIFFAEMRPIFVHIFESRREAFSDDAILQENIILHARRRTTDALGDSDEVVEMSSSAGQSDLAEPARRTIPLNRLIDQTSRDKHIHLPLTAEADHISAIVRTWSGTLHQYGLQISTGPVVAFRAQTWLVPTVSDLEQTAPLLWLQHVSPMQVTWPLPKFAKPQGIMLSPETRHLLVANRNYVLLRRFSAKEEQQRLVAAPHSGQAIPTMWLGLENHLNYIYRVGGDLSLEETWGLAALLNSSLLDTFFRIFSGNTQVSATELRSLPLPPMEVIRALGNAVLKPNRHESTDSLLQSLLTDGLYA